jgi:hypothetical protein
MVELCIKKIGFQILDSSFQFPDSRLTTLSFGFLFWHIGIWNLQFWNHSTPAASTVTAMTTGADRSGPLTSSMRSIESFRLGSTLR